MTVMFVISLHLPDGVSLSEGQLPVSLGLEVVERLAEGDPGHGRGHAARRPGRRSRRGPRGWAGGRGVGGGAPGRGRGRVAPASVSGPDDGEKY